MTNGITTTDQTVEQGFSDLSSVFSDEFGNVDFTFCFGEDDGYADVDDEFFDGYSNFGGGRFVSFSGLDFFGGSGFSFGFVDGDFGSDGLGGFTCRFGKNFA